MIQEKILSRETAKAQEPQAACSLCCLNIYSFGEVGLGLLRARNKRTGSSLPVPFSLGNNLHTMSAHVMHMPCTAHAMHMACTGYTAQVCTSPLLPSSALGFCEDFILQVLVVTCGHALGFWGGLAS